MQGPDGRQSLLRRGPDGKGGTDKAVLAPLSLNRSHAHKLKPRQSSGVDHRGKTESHQGRTSATAAGRVAVSLNGGRAQLISTFFQAQHND